CIALIALLIPTKIPLKNWPLQVIFYSLGLFLFSVITSIFFSFDRYESLREFFLLGGALIIFMKSFSLFESPKTLDRFFWWLLGGTVLFSLYGLYIFMGAGPLFRLGSVFYQQNAFAGFMLPSLFFVVGNMLYASTIKKRILWATVGIFLFTTFFFTFARGAALALSGAFLIVSLLLQWPVRRWLRAASILIVVGGVSGVFVLGLFNAKITSSQGSIGSLPNTPITHPSQIFEAETNEDNGMTARFRYLYDAGRIFVHHPVTGVGWGAFGDAATRYRETLKNYTTDPHNIIARAFVELGLLGGLALFSFLVVMIFMIFKILRYFRNSDRELIVFVVSGSFLALFFQNLVNADWMFPSNLFLFWIIAGMVVWFYSIATALPIGKPILPFQEQFIVGWSFLVLVVGFITVIAHTSFTNASERVFERDIAGGLFAYQTAVRFNPLNPLYRRDLALLYLELAPRASDPKMRNRYLAASLTEIESGLRMKPHDPYLLFLRGRAHILMGDIRRGEASLQQALREDSLMLLVAYRDLSNIYFQKKEYQAVASLIQPILEVYSREAFGSILWINPYKEDAKKDIADLWVRFGLAKIGLKDEAGAK
ncbi:MAG: O-antigen ligase family protein, partial [Patescibacteria group bacterium]